MYETVLVPVDGSPEADGAVAHAIALARVDGGTVHAFSVIESEGELGTERPEAAYRFSEPRGRQATAQVADLAGDAGVDVVRHVREGIPYQEITAYVDEFDVDLIVMGTRGAAAADRTRLGSTAERVITFADVPVVTVRLTEDAITDAEHVSIERIVVPTDGSDDAERAAEVGLDLAEFVDARVDVVYVVDRTIYDLEDAPRSIIGLLREGGRNAIEAVERDARDRGLTVRTEVLRGVPETELRAYADGVDADLLAMGTRGRGATGDRLLGSTTARVVRRADRPVLTVNSSR
ncbi:universal stress protein [Natronoglomus mannanivorans]|uniref:Universal stress protein n=1 Tax=Natronoglomus mannanivorans TaxID=2979990 RepID=A0AAP2Z3K4_9EURY|nr:universal stress protein [Halobacteria archaeon AArc-xg1-1]